MLFILPQVYIFRGIKEYLFIFLIKVGQSGLKWEIFYSFTTQIHVMYSVKNTNVNNCITSYLYFS